jgi:hypothetical protein
MFDMFFKCFIFISVVFLLGLYFYKPEQPLHENILFKVISFVNHAIVQKIKRQPTDCIRYSESFVKDVSAFFKVKLIVLYKKQ